MNSEIPNTTVFAYHNILPPGSPATADKGCIPLDRLEEHLSVLNDEGFKNVSLEKAFHHLVEHNDKSAESFYAITFDDGYKNLHAFLPGLLDRIQPTIFHVTNYTGKSNLTWNTRSPVIQEHLTLDQILELMQYGVDIEYHGTDHHNLIKFDETELQLLFKKGVEWFEKYLNKKPKYISYPYGYCDKRIINIASNYFLGGVTVTHGDWSGPKAKYALNRISVPYYLTGKDLVEIIRTNPADRWLEIEGRAPWRRKKEVIGLVY
jgi:peptidoglycan/xylan/chitin deacetylase (PgdA/CDA1 family)